MKVTQALLFAVMAFQANALFDSQSSKTDVKQNGGKGGDSHSSNGNGGNGGNGGSQVSTFQNRTPWAMASLYRWRDACIMSCGTAPISILLRHALNIKHYSPAAATAPPVATPRAREARERT